VKAFHLNNLLTQRSTTDPDVRGLARKPPPCSNVRLKVDCDAARRMMIQWIADRAVQLYRSKHGQQG
jgi:hypothetical protein